VDLFDQDLMNANRSALIVAASVVGMPFGKPEYEINFPFFKSFTAFFAVN
jgi:hypothetical protein